LKITRKSFLWGYAICILSFLATTSCKNSAESDNNVEDNYSENAPLGSKNEIDKLLSQENQVSFFQLDSIKKFYAVNPNPVWSDLQFRTSFIEVLKKTDLEGLSYSEYHGQDIDTLTAHIRELNNKERSRLDVLLTDAYFQYSNHLLNGKIEPRKIHEVFDIPRNEASFTNLLKQSLEANDFEVAFKKIRPTNPIYTQLISALKEFKEKKEEFEEFKDIEEGDLIKPGMQDGRMPKIKFRLMALGYLKNIDPFTYDHSEAVQEAIKNLQLDNGLLADGIVGNSTIALLNIDYKDRYNQILANLERWRWYPRDLGEHYILVNIANYQLEVLKNDEVVSSHKTMVGTDVRKTPIFSEEIKYIVFNPTWTIPPTIKSKDVIPGVRKNIDYLSKKHLNVYNANGERLDPSEIDWNNNRVNSYTYRQNPGGSNPLGVVKIIYPNKHLIYLHDTPSKSLFSRNSRAQSSGCIRVEAALELAQYLLEDQPEYISEKIEEIIATGKTTQVKMKQHVKVHHFYWTAWLENGKPKFTEDIYKYDKKIISELLKDSKP
tara:strand:+ start:50516 stop:52156 length:1641 start_codon:yes stop_codon:yes gene_type:complete